MSEAKKASLTILLPAGRLPLDIMAKTHEMAKKYAFNIYLSNAQNLKILDIPEVVLEEVKDELSSLGANFKGPGKFPLPKVCAGKKYCNLGVIDTEALSTKILDTFSGRAHTKAKFKIGISGCTLCCSGAKTTDIGIIGTQDGFELYAGGKGGSFPKVGRRIGQKLGEDELLTMVATLVEFHDKKTEKKQRIIKLLTDPEFPYPEL
ncbi:nitrite reductase [Desulforhopalus sp. IMCC35007]|uniref:nitrite reductase n=1 Tax=Desulforhopalus sp. IMCC35007 TaxID=2569543 RepID=UPI0010AE40F9|nr:nitrite reductase [Desulforhopalus sp. IMCC35007]TKB10621.1 nitrite reductase [Desulforhopalus sp. IMCC35007]